MKLVLKSHFFGLEYQIIEREHPSKNSEVYQYTVHRRWKNKTEHNLGRHSRDSR